MLPVALGQLCRRYGIETSWTDIWGERHEISGETARALLRAMGVEADDDQQAAAACEDFDRSRWSRMMNPVAVQRAGMQPAAIALRAPAACRDQSVEWTVATETGETLSGAVDGQELVQTAARLQDGAELIELRFALPETPLSLPTGKHRLTLADLAIRHPGYH